MDDVTFAATTSATNDDVASVAANAVLDDETVAPNEPLADYHTTDAPGYGLQQSTG